MQKDFMDFHFYIVLHLLVIKYRILYPIDASWNRLDVRRVQTSKTGVFLFYCVTRRDLALIWKNKKKEKKKKKKTEVNTSSSQLKMKS